MEEKPFFLLTFPQKYDIPFRTGEPIERNRVKTKVFRRCSGYDGYLAGPAKPDRRNIKPKPVLRSCPWK